MTGLRLLPVILSFLLLAAHFYRAGLVLPATLTVAGRPKLVLYLAGAMMTAALAGHWFVIPLFGAAGAAWVWIISRRRPRPPTVP